MLGKDAVGSESVIAPSRALLGSRILCEQDKHLLLCFFTWGALRAVLLVNSIVI